ncbi:MAG: flagellar basal body rod protein FlgC [Myxococcota bacterium]
MTFSDIVDIAASGLSAQRARMTVTASNLANAESTRTEAGGPYRRRDVVFAARPLAGGFRGEIDRAMRSVQVDRVVQDPRPPLTRYQPDHPDADAEGYVQLPRVEPVEEFVNMLSASRSFEANLLVLRKAREMGRAALQIGR